MKILSDTTIFNNLLKALDTGMTIYIKDDNYTSYTSLAVFNYILNNNIPTIIMGFYYFEVFYKVTPSEGYSDSDLYTPTNLIISEEAASTPAT